ncbi:hypothetical protein SCHPADRAFT_902232 [Schizopora paradoxa]|uniref:HTH La-type RNA-binding domain-containing protein n=1 Tax=Schizopora paradoxa TaxID=27342 RepID=A0A0H2SEW0_9AGAM|nr:hypothetical protein SCHPADRAFT_902232 [Schizopora paradoxa]
MSEEVVEKTVPVEETEITSTTEAEVPASSGDAEASTSKTEDAVEAAGGEEDATMDENEEDKKRRACRQIEFYFSDSNLPYDRFMWTLHTTNDEHWVPIETVASFKRMREYKTFGTPWIVEALKTSDQLEVDESNTKLRRRSEVQEPKGQFERSIYAKGFGEETPDLQKKLEDFFNKYGYCNAVRMRRDEEKKFKGSVFAEFSDTSSVHAFLNADPKPSWNGEDLLIMTKEAYCEMKIKEKGLKGKEATARREQNKSNINRKGFNAFKEMERQNKSGDSSKSKPEVFLEFMGHKIRVHEKDGGTIEEADIPHVKGSVLKFTGLEGATLDMSDLKSRLTERFERPPFVKYTKDSEYGLLAFNKALSEEDIAFVKEKAKTIDSKEITWSPAEEEDEKQFLIERAKFAAKRAYESTVGSSGGRGGRGGRGGKFGGRGQGGGRGRGRGRGGGGRGGHRDAKPSNGTDSAKAEDAGSEQAGEKRKRTIEPDGSSDVGTRNAKVPVIQATKKAKTDEAAATAS